jgi:hypothetical protein
LPDSERNATDRAGYLTLHERHASFDCSRRPALALRMREISSGIDG